jgi:hypothetical protein
MTTSRTQVYTNLSADIRERLKITNTVEATQQYQQIWKKSLDENEKSLTSTTGILLLTKRKMKLRMTK